MYEEWQRELDSRLSGYTKKQNFHLIGFLKIRFWGMGGQNGNRRFDSHETLLTTPTHVKKIVVGSGIGIGIILLVINIHRTKKIAFSPRRL